MDREKKTVEIMIRMYCADHHPGHKILCAECGALSDYVRLRLQKCPFKKDKPTCAACTIHCYSPAMRAKVVSVMRYSGPRMLLKHPILAIAHLRNGRKAKAVPKGLRSHK